MIQVDFYLLKTGYPMDIYKFSCRLIEKIYNLGNRAYIHAGSDNEARHIDRLLWTFRDGSFIPHGLIGTTDPVLTPILIGSGENPEYLQFLMDILINFAPDIPEFANKFRRIVEVLDDDPDKLRLGRERYRHYKQLGYILNPHEMTNITA